MKPKESKQAKNTPPGPKDFNKFIGGLDLLDIRIREASFRFADELHAQEHAPSIRTEIKASFTPVRPDLFEAQQVFALRVIGKGTKRALGRLTCELMALYRSSNVEVNEALFEVFKDTTLILNTWPFIREFLYSCTLRAGLPPLVLPLAKFTPQS